jgi:hypothetical protein
MQKTFLALAVGAAMVLAPASALAIQQTSNRQAAAPTTANWQIPLTTNLAHLGTSGSAQYQAQPGQREFQIELHRLASLRGSSLLVRINGGAVGSMKVAANGIAQLTQNSELGQKVPPLTHGSTVTVKTTAGLVIATGRF